MDCLKCSKQINSSLNFCPFCGEKVNNEIIPLPPSNTQQLENITLSQHQALNNEKQENRSSYYVVEGYYAKRFYKIDENYGQYVFFWNWYAALFSPLWFLVKGMWAKGLILFLLALITAGIASPFIGIYGGMRGTYDLYLAKVQKKQMWFL